MRFAGRFRILRLPFIDEKRANFNRNIYSNSTRYSSSKCFLRITKNGEFLYEHLKNINMATSNYSRVVDANGVMKSEFPPLPIQKEHFSKTFLDAIWQHFSDDPDRVAIINGNNDSDRVTFGQLYIYCHSVAAFLRKYKFEKQQIACIVTPNCWQYMATFGGVVLCRGILSGASPAFTSSELKQQFDDSKCTFIFTSEDCVKRVIEATKKNENIKAIIVIPERRGVSAKLPKAPVPVFSFADVVREDPAIGLPISLFDFSADKEVMILPYSSGTTGLPKGVMLSHKNFGSIMNMYTWQFNHKVLYAIDSKYDYKKETQLNLLPFYHIFGFAVMVNHLLNGSTVAVLKTFNLELCCSLLQKYKCRFLMVVPPLMIFLAKSPVVDNYDLSNLKLIMSGAAPAGRELCEKLQLRFPQLTITQGYGMTELSIGSHMPVVDGKDRFEKAGKLLPNMELKILDIKSGEPLTAKGEAGELYLRGPNVMMGYLGRPEANAEALTEDGWLRTGDIAFIDEEGYLCVVDRLKELIKVRGYQVAPAELEDLLLSMPKVQDCAVIGLPDEASGEVPAAFIVRVDESITDKEVFQYVNENVANYKRLRGGVTFVNQIPKSPSGKILRRELRQKYFNEKSKL